MQSAKDVILICSTRSQDCSRKFASNDWSMVTPPVGEEEWRSCLEGLPQWEAPSRLTLVIAPHPDDETLGVGGLILRLRKRGLKVRVAAVTNGENSYPEMSGEERSALGRERTAEQERALSRLGVSTEDVVRFWLPDSGVGECESELVDRLLPLVDGETHVIAPWTRDFHPDHEACGRAAAEVARRTGAKLSYYFFWTWHRGTVALVKDLPLQRLELQPAEVEAKMEALREHRTQLFREGGEAILPPALLGPAMRSFEVFLDA